MRPDNRHWLERLLRVEPIDDVHAAFSFFEDLRVGGEPVAVATWPSTRYHIYWPRWLKVLVSPLNHVALLVQILAARPWRRVVIVREFHNEFVLAMSPVLWWFRRRLVLNVNHNFAVPLGKGVRGWCLSALVKLGFRFLLLDGEPAREAVTACYPGIRLATPLFPVSRLSHRTDGREEPALPFSIGFVGDFRRDKGGPARLFDVVSRLAAIDGVRVRVGLWNPDLRRAFAERMDSRVQLCSTYAPHEYEEFIASCDATMILAEKNAYYYRHSSIMMDAVRSGTLPIAPDYPLFSCLGLTPVPVGVLYRDLTDLPRLVRDLMDNAPRLRRNFTAHAAARTPAPVAAQLETLLDLHAPARVGRVASAVRGIPVRLSIHGLPGRYPRVRPKRYRAKKNS